MALKVTTFSSKGRATRIKSIKNNEIYHLQSDNQLRLFLLLEWTDVVTDITVNHELNNLKLNLENIENLRLDKFIDKEIGKLYKLHTNFLITMNKQNLDEQVAISVKSVTELERKVVIEKLEIERRYWNNKGIKFYIITDKELDKTVVDNIMWVRETLFDKEINNKEKLSNELYCLLEQNRHLAIKSLLKVFDSDKHKDGMGLFIFRYLIAKKRIKINMKLPMNLENIIDEMIDFEVNTNAF